jgi:hypothetical protein
MLEHNRIHTTGMSSIIWKHLEYGELYMTYKGVHCVVSTILLGLISCLESCSQLLTFLLFHIICQQEILVWHYIFVAYSYPLTLIQ